MDRAYSASVIRAAEAGPLNAGERLMERAAASLATTAIRELRARGYKVTGSEILALAGGGNNGGDVLYAAGMLARRGAAVSLLLATEKVHEEGLSFALAHGCREVSLEGGLRAGLWLDGLTGLGFTPPLRPELSSIISQLAASKDSAPDEPIVIATDLPSGLSADSGRVDGPVLAAHVTCAFGGLKPVHLLPPASYLCGRVDLIDLDLGLARPEIASVDRDDVLDLFASPGPTDHKYTRGVVTIQAGSSTYPGAGVLACAGALHAGAGMVRAVTCDETRASLLASFPEVLFGGGRSDALVVGPGLTEVDGWQAGEAIGSIPVVLDAGGLQIARRGLPSSVVLTPHAGELVGLLSRLGIEISRSDVEADPMTWAQRTRDLTGATVVLKGGTDVIAGEQCYAQRSASAWGALAGAGDVYAGVLGAFLARGEDIAASAAAASWACGEARRARGPIRALDQARRISEVIGE